MPVDEVAIRERIAELEKQAKKKLERRVAYGESGLRRTRLTDDLLREAKELEAKADELRRLLSD